MSHVEAPLSIWFALRAETPSLGLKMATESIVFVGTAKSVVGARARMRVRVFVKIIVDRSKM